MVNDVIVTKSAEVALGQDGIVRIIYLPGSHSMPSEVREITAAIVQVCKGR